MPLITQPRHEKDKKTLGQVERRATKPIPVLKECDYVDGLKALDLSSLHYRRDRGDVTECCKVTHDMSITPQMLKL